MAYLLLLDKPRQAALRKRRENDIARKNRIAMFDVGDVPGPGPKGTMTASAMSIEPGHDRRRHA